jgi:hypothetical protein
MGHPLREQPRGDGVPRVMWDQRRLVAIAALLSAVASCTSWPQDDVWPEEAEDRCVAGDTGAVAWSADAFLPRIVEAPLDAPAWHWPHEEAFRERWLVDDGPRSLGIIDADILAYGGQPPSDERHLANGSRSRLLLAVSDHPDGWALAGMAGPGMGLCRGTCAVRDSLFTFADMDASPCDRAVEIVQDQALLFDLELRAPAPPRDANARYWADRIYTRTLIEEASCRDDGDGACLSDGRAAGHLASRIQRHARARLEATEPSLVTHDELASLPIDLERFFVGLTLRFDGWAQDEEGSLRHVSLPASWYRATPSPAPDVVALVILDVGMAEAMAERLWVMVSDAELDRYNRVRAASVLLALLDIDPSVGDEAPLRPASSFPTEAFQIAGADLVASVDLAANPAASIEARLLRGPRGERRRPALAATLSWLLSD